MDTFDYKPELFAKDGKQIDFVEYVQIPLKSKQTDFDETPLGVQEVWRVRTICILSISKHS